MAKYVSSVCSRQAFKNFYKMLKPGGQFFISTFEESPLDQAFETLDDGKWSKYNHRDAISCFYKYENPSKEFEKIIKQEGFVDIQIRTEPNCFIPFSEKSFIGMSLEYHYNLKVLFSHLMVLPFPPSLCRFF